MILGKIADCTHKEVVVSGFRQKEKMVAILVIFLHIFIVLFVVSPGFSQETVRDYGTESGSEVFSFNNRWSFSVTGRFIELDNLDETYTFSPLERFISAKNPKLFISDKK